MQRILSSHPDVLIWGEHAGQLRPLLSAASRLRVWADEDGLEAREHFQVNGFQSFMANLMPEAASVDNAARAFVEALFVDPARDLGKKVWGIKEVRYGLVEARALSALFPGAVVIGLVRDPRDVLRSLHYWEQTYAWWSRADTTKAVRDWSRIAGSFLYAGPTDSPPVLRLRYEDLVAAPDRVVGQIGAHTSLDVAAFDAGVLAKKVHITGSEGSRPRTLPTWDELDQSMRNLLDDDDIRMVAASYGYDL